MLGAPAPDHRRGRTYRLVLALALLVLGGAAWQLLSAGVAGIAATPQYVLVIDAGSSGTRLLAYSWALAAAPGPGGAGAPASAPRLTPILPSAAADHVPRRALGKRRAYARVETEPGLDAYVGDAEGMEAMALRPLLDWARAALPRAAWARTPVFLLGTAGLRRLPLADQRWVLDTASAVLAHSAFRFERAWARVLGGEDEGVYGWVALNYLQVGGGLAAAAVGVVVVGW